MNPSLLPEPQSVRLGPGRMKLAEPLRIFLSEDTDKAALRGALRLSHLIKTELNHPASVDRQPHAASVGSGHIMLSCDTSSPQEDYRLHINSSRVIVSGSGLPGLSYGIETLIQLVRQYGRHLPCGVIKDQPAFSNRGYYLDISRGKVPTLSTLKRLVDRLAALKFNQLQLYIEHVFDFHFDPEIGEGAHPIRPEEILELDEYGRERHIELVPSLACFGHMGRILSLPRYRKLAEVEWPAPDWHQATSQQRLHGATINPRDPRSKKLLARMFADFLPLFRSKCFNVCADETYDLGRGKNARSAGRGDTSKVYLEHIRYLRKLAAEYGKRIMFWGDVMLQYPDAIPRIPRDCTVLDWGYDRRTCYQKVAQFTEAGLKAYVCPATRGYRMVFNEVEEARANITGYAGHGIKLGASGLLVTDWGDMGHFNLLACSLHGMAVAAAASWNPRAEARRWLDKAFALQVFGDRTGSVAGLYRNAGTTGIAQWAFLIGNLRDAPDTKISREQARKIGHDALRWARAFRHIPPRALVVPHDLEELAMGCEALRLNAEKVLIADSIAERRKADPSLRKKAQTFGLHMEDFAARYEDVWVASNRLSGLNEVSRALRRVARQARRLGK